MINVVERPEGQRCWVVRAQGGNYIEHFRQGGTVAIGHLDELKIQPTGNRPFFPDPASLVAEVSGLEKRKGNANWKDRSRRRVGQVKVFINEISVGDIVVSIDSSHLMVGRVTGHPRINSEPIRIFHDVKNNDYTEMKFSLRRSVNWGPSMRRDNIPSAMKRSINARQTVFNVDKYWATIYHMLYPVFVFENKIYFSTKINQQGAISNYSISQLFSILTDMEVLIRSADFIDASKEIDFDYIFEKLFKRDGFELVTTAEFMSPGSVWSYLGVDDKVGGKLTIAAFLFGIFFGIKVGPIEFDGIFHKEIREQVANEFMKRLEYHNAELVKDRLELSFPDFDTKPLETKKFDEPEGYKQLTFL